MRGRPLKFQSVQELQSKIDDYFSTEEEQLQTITGLAVHLDTSRETLCNYEEKDDFFDTIKKAKDRIEMAYERDLRRKGRSGDIFALKNFGWRDKTEQDITSGGETLTPLLVRFIDEPSTNNGDTSGIQETV